MAMAALPLALLVAASGLARVRAQGEIRWAGDLQGGEPYVFRDPRVGTLASWLAHQILRGLPGIEIVLYGGQEEPYRDLELHRTDAVLLDSIIATRYGLGKPDLELADPDVARGSYVIGLRKGD